MNRYVTIGLTMLAGAALLEAALIPGLVIGGAAVLAPNFLPKRRRARTSNTTRRQAAPAAAPLPVAVPARFAIKQAVAKTITFRIIVTTLDFTTNYIVIGEFATAAGLSAFGLVVGPLFYLAHETAWNYYGPPGGGADVPVPLPWLSGALADPDAPDGQAFTISRALAKTVTFRTIATAMDFTVNYVVVGDLATAVGLSAFAFVVGPFVYLGHEMLWDRYGSLKEPLKEPFPQSTNLLPAPA